jgi:hypothetical protein
MREIITKAWCDLHQHNGDDRVEGTMTRELSLDGGAPRELDLCASCDEQLFGLIVKLLNGGRVPEATIQPRKPKQRMGPTNDQLCPICGVAYAMDSTVVSHVWSEHVGRPRPRQPEECPDCGQRKENGMAMARHRKLHNYDRMQEALDAVNPPKKGRQHA